MEYALGFYIYILRMCEVQRCKVFRPVTHERGKCLNVNDQRSRCFIKFSFSRMQREEDRERKGGVRHPLG